MVFVLERLAAPPGIAEKTSLYMPLSRRDPAAAMASRMAFHWRGHRALSCRKDRCREEDPRWEWIDIGMWLGEIARFGIEVRCAISIPVTLRTVAENAVALIERLPMLGVSHQMTNVALLRVAGQRAK